MKNSTLDNKVVSIFAPDESTTDDTNKQLDLLRSLKNLTVDEEEFLLGTALAILESRMRKVEDLLNSSQLVKDYLRMKIGSLEHEVFIVIFLNNQHQVLKMEVLFRGTIDQASIYPREVVKAALRENAAAMFVAHNHPAQSMQPSYSDKVVTERLKTSLELIGVRLLDHLIIGLTDVFSFAEAGLL